MHFYYLLTLFFNIDLIAVAAMLEIIVTTKIIWQTPQVEVWRTRYNALPDKQLRSRRDLNHAVAPDWFHVSTPIYIAVLLGICLSQTVQSLACCFYNVPPQWENISSNWTSSLLSHSLRGIVWPVKLTLKAEQCQYNEALSNLFIIIDTLS